MASPKRYTLYGLMRSGKRTLKARIGALVRREDGDGFDVYFDALPVGNRGMAVAEPEETDA